MGEWMSAPRTSGNQPPFWWAEGRTFAKWSQILEDAEAAMKAGTPATDAKVQELARRYDELGKWFSAGFTGGDPGLKESLNRVWAERGDELHAAYGKGPQVN